MPGLLCFGSYQLSTTRGGIAAGAASRSCAGCGLFNLETTLSIFFNKFDGCSLQVSQGLIIYDDLYAKTGIYLVAIADLVIQ